MESEKMVELFGIDATAVGEKEYPLGTEVRAFPNGDQLVARVNDEVVASFSKRYINSLKAESEKRILLGARTGDTIRLSVPVSGHEGHSGKCLRFDKRVERFI